MKAFEIKTFFSFTIFGVTVPITESVIISWVVMLILIVGSIILVRKLEIVPKGFQAVLEAGVEFLNNYTAKQFGPFAKFLTPYMGSLFLFLLVGNVIGMISPFEVKAFGHEFVPPFMLRPPTRDINVTAALGCISILLVLVCGFAARGIVGWFKHLFHPIAFMLPFNIMEYGTRLLSLSLRLFGNILGGFVLMHLIEGLFPIALPMVFALYFDIFDGVVQATIFVFLTSLYIHEAVKIEEE
jgi:F-type H+-transporting ATPase subunit a